MIILLVSVVLLIAAAMVAGWVLNDYYNDRAYWDDDPSAGLDFNESYQTSFSTSGIVTLTKLTAKEDENGDTDG